MDWSEFQSQRQSVIKAGNVRRAEQRDLIVVLRRRHFAHIVEKIIGYKPEVQGFDNEKIDEILYK